MTEHRCIDCLREDPIQKRPARPLASRKPARCHTHLRAFNTRQRKQARARTIERTYDISADDAHELYLFQEGRCWLCRKATGATKSLAVDHDHATDEVRGRLCGPCNQFIGKLGDDPDAARRLVRYLTGDTPYRRLKARQLIGHATQLTPVIMAISAPVPGGRELYADWHSEGATAWYRWRVRDIDGVWAVRT